MKNLLKPLLMFACLLLALPAQSGWNPLAKEKDADQPGNDEKVREAIAAFKNKDPSMQAFFDHAYGYAVFPTVGKGGMGIGGAYGKGQVFQQGRVIGSVSLTQLTIGFQLGGQAYSEIIFFKDKSTLDEFTSGLDQKVGQEILGDLLHLFRRQTIICITHEKSIAQHFDRMIHL